jgi:hypothetical protein
MEKKYLKTFLIFFVFVVNLFARSLFKDDVDAITEATINNSCKFVLPIETTDSSAIIKWTETRNGGKATFCYDTIEPPLVCRSVTSIERTIKTINLYGLKPSTTYYIYLEVTQTNYTPYAASGSFTTKAKSANLIKIDKNKEQDNIYAKRKIIFVNKKLYKNDKITITNIYGQNICNFILNNNCSSLKININSAGLYIIQIINDKKQYCKFNCVAF